MDGILIIDKPAGLTSHDVVAWVRRTLKTKRVGHTGTLDPFATGVMVILVGRATRLAQFLDKDEKEYEAVIEFGSETDTGDVMGVRTADCGLLNEEIADIVGRTNWDDIFSSFRGEIEQIPPMYSAKKIAGKKLYEHARKGNVVERESVQLVIKLLDLLQEPAIGDRSIGVRVVCSAGTYIRQLAEDFGRKIGIGAHLTGLRRTRAGRFSLAEAVTLDQLEDKEAPERELKPIELAIEHLQSITLAADRVEKTRNGLSTRISNTDFEDQARVRMVDETGDLVAVGTFDQTENVVVPKIVLV